MSRLSVSFVRSRQLPRRQPEDEQRVYDLVSGYLLRDDSYGVPTRQRHLVGLILRKLLASSTEAVVATLEVILARLRRLEDSQAEQDDWISRLIEDEELNADLLDEEEDERASDEDADPGAETQVDPAKLRAEIVELEQYLLIARGVREDQKSHALLKALDTGFERSAGPPAAGSPQLPVRSPAPAAGCQPGGRRPTAGAGDRGTYRRHPAWPGRCPGRLSHARPQRPGHPRSEEHTSELQSREISYAVYRLK